MFKHFKLKKWIFKHRYGLTAAAIAIAAFGAGAAVSYISCMDTIDELKGYTDDLSNLYDSLGVTKQGMQFYILGEEYPVEKVTDVIGTETASAFPDAMAKIVMIQNQ